MVSNITKSQKKKKTTKNMVVGSLNSLLKIITTINSWFLYVTPILEFLKDNPYKIQLLSIKNPSRNDKALPENKNSTKMNVEEISSD